MADCGVCVSFGDGTECVGYRCVVVRAGQDWDCSECGRFSSVFDLFLAKYTNVVENHLKPPEQAAGGGFELDKILKRGQKWQMNKKRSVREN